MWVSFPPSDDYYALEPRIADYVHWNSITKMSLNDFVKLRKLTGVPQNSFSTSRKLQLFLLRWLVFQNNSTFCHLASGNFYVCRPVCFF